MIPNLTIERLIELVRANPDKPVLETLEEWRGEYARGLAEHEAQLKAMYAANPVRYGLARYELAYEAEGGTYRSVTRPVEFVAVEEQDLEEFAKSHGIKLGDLWAVLRGTALEAKGGWRSWETPSWSASRYFVDRTLELQTRQVLEQEDRETARYLAERDEAAKRPARPVSMFPSFSIFRKGAN